MKRLAKEDKAGLYITVIVHLVVLIILLATQIDRAIKAETSFVLDFTKMEQLEKLQREVAFKEEISKRLEEMIAEGGAPVRNVTVDRGVLKDDRGTDAEELYKDAERLQKELDKGFKAKEDDFVETTPEKNKSEEKNKEQKYSGPSVLSYELEGRKASHLPIPAYRCMGAGEVKVLITVDNSGTVLSARVDDSCSSSDGCLRAFAVRAARLSKFSASQSAPPRQAGNIVYKFIAQ